MIMIIAMQVWMTKSENFQILTAPSISICDEIEDPTIAIDETKISEIEATKQYNARVAVSKLKKCEFTSRNTAQVN